MSNQPESMDANDRPRTWEYLYGALEAAIKWCQEIAASYPEYFATHDVQRSLDTNLGLYDILPALQNHPVIGKHIPYLAVGEFHWMPAEYYWVSVDTISGRNRFSVRRGYQEQTLEQAVVSTDEVIPTLLDYMFRANGTGGSA